MDWITGSQKAIDYVEDNLVDELDYERRYSDASAPCRKRFKTYGIRFTLNSSLLRSIIPAYEINLEAYYEGNMDDNNYVSEIWIPVEKK